MIKLKTELIGGGTALASISEYEGMQQITFKVGKYTFTFEQMQRFLSPASLTFLRELDKECMQHNRERCYGKRK